MKCDGSDCRNPAVRFEFIAGVAYKWCQDCYAICEDIDPVAEAFVEDYKSLTEGEYAVISVMVS